MPKRIFGPFYNMIFLVITHNGIFFLIKASEYINNITLTKRNIINLTYYIDRFFLDFHILSRRHENIKVPCTKKL